MAAELATNRWSDHMGVTLVGFGEDLALLAPERVRAVATLEEVLPELEARAEETRQALAAAGVDSVLTGRCRGVSGEAWMPHFVLVAHEPAPRDRERLLRLSGIWQRTPTGYLVAGDVPGAAWSLQVADDGASACRCWASRWRASGCRPRSTGRWSSCSAPPWTCSPPSQGRARPRRRERPPPSSPTCNASPPSRCGSSARSR
jgi:hypothetical protein